MRNSNCLEIRKPPSSLPVKRKSEKLEKHNTLRSLSSNRDKENSLSSYSGSEQSAKVLALKTMKDDVHHESVGGKRKKLTGRAFKSLLRRKHNNGNGSAVDDLKDSQTSSLFRETSNNSPPKSNDVSEPENATCSRRSAHDAINPECVAGTTPCLSECENCSLLGTCIFCFKEKRISFDSQEKELCTCGTTTQKDLECSSTCKDRVHQGGSVSLESAKRCHCGNLLKEPHLNSQMDDRGTVCALCNNDGELLCCEGKDCKINYHLSCLDPRLPDDLPGVRHCPKCVNKKLQLGVYCVSDGVESILGVRDVEVPIDKGIKQRQYLVKYHGLAHIHNHWVPEQQLLLKHQLLISSFIAKEEIGRWSVDWTVPHRLLRKRLILDKFRTASPENKFERYEWLVKWHDLDYDHCTWELDSSCFLNTSLGRGLMKEYEVRREKAKREVDKCQKGSFVELPELPVSGLNANDNFLLKNVDKLRECWYKCQNTVVFDDQDQARTLVFFIQSLTEICHPFLIVAASDSLSQWKAEFARLAPSVDVVVYNGNSDTRKRIRASEFYEEGGCVMVQVLLSSPEAVFEDIDMLCCIRWQSIVIDEYQHSGISIDFEQIKILTTDSRVLLRSGQIKDTTSEYLNLLSLLDSEHEYNKLRGLRSGKNENLAKLKERLSRFIAYGSTSEISRFIEYWVPVQISNHQLEQYCATLISNSIHLCSCSRNDKVGSLRDVLLAVRKCCDHPYLVDSSIQEHMIAEGRPADEILDVGIKTSGKLQILDMMLTQVKTRGLKVVVLFESFGSGGCSTGYLLSDFLAQKFGQDSYERVFAGVSPTTKQAAVNRFNKMENGQFVLLLENRACSSTIKLSSLDVIVLYNSDWNPANEFKSLQKLSIDTFDQIKVFRLYSSCTVEERALILAKKNLNLDNNLQASLNRASSDSLLMWGAAQLFSKLDEYHSGSSSDINSMLGQLVLNETIEEFKSILSEHGEISKKVPIISKVKLDVGSYSTNMPMLGEAEVKLKDVEEPHHFWKNLLDRKVRQWKHIMGQCQRNRKRAHYMENVNAGNKRRSALIEHVYQASAPAELQEHQKTQVNGPEGGPSKIIACNVSQSSLRGSDNSLGNRDGIPGRSTFNPEVEECAAKEGNASSDEQKSLHNSLQEEIERLCQILKLSEDVTHTMRRFLEYVLSNNQIWRDSPSIMQAFQISLVWVAASISKQEVDKTESLVLARQLLNYQCTEEQVHLVYSKMLDLKWTYMHCSPNDINIGGDSLLAEETAENETCNTDRRSSPSSWKTKIEENHTNDEHCGSQNLAKPKQPVKHKGVLNSINSIIDEVQRKCDKRMKKLVKKQKKEIQDVFQNWEARKLKLETDQKLASALIRCIYGEDSARRVKLKQLDEKFAKEMEENNLLKDVQLKGLEGKHLAAKNEEREKAAHWIAKAKANCCSDLGSVSTPAEEVDVNASIGTLSNSPIIGQSKLNGETIFASEEKVSDEMGSVELNKEVPPEVPENVIVDSVDHEEVISNSSKEYDKGDTVCLADTLVDQRDGIHDKLPGVPSARQISEHSEQTEACLHRCDSLPLRVPKDQTFRSLSADLQDQGAPHSVEDQNTFQFEVAASELVDNATVRQPTSKLQDEDALAPAVEDHGTLQIGCTKSTQGDTLVPDAPAPVVEDHCTLHIEGTNSSKGDTVISDAPTAAPTVEDHGTLQIEGADSPQDDTVTSDTPAPAPAVEDHDTLHIECTKSTQGDTLSPDAPTRALDDHSPLQFEGTNSPQGDALTSDAPTPAPTVEDHVTLQNEGTSLAEGGTVTHDAPTVEDHVTLQIEGGPAPTIENLDNLHIDGTKSTQGDTLAPDAPVPAVEDHDTLHIEGTNSTQGDTFAPDAPAPAVEDHDTLHIDSTNSAIGGCMTTLQSNDDAQAIGNIEQLNHVSNGESPIVNQSTTIQDGNQNHDLPENSSRSAEAAETEMIPRETPSRTAVNSEMQTNHIDIGHETSIELSADSQDNVVMSEAIVDIIEPPNQTSTQLGIDLGNQDTSWDSPYLFELLFRKQLDDIRRETEQLEKNRKETMSQLKSDFEKEVQEVLAQELKRYEVKLKDAEAEYILRKKGLVEYHKKVCMNKLLAKAFSCICEDPELPRIQQDTPSNPVSINHFQAFRPCAPSSIPQNRPGHQGGPPHPWGPPALELMRAIHRHSRVSGGVNFFGFY